MDLRDAYNYLLFWVNKYAGAWFPPEELDAIVDKGQLLYYKDCFKKYGTGQRLTDALGQLKKSYSFDPIINQNPNGLINTPIDYMDLISIYTTVNGKRYPVPVLNEDELTGRVNSQVIPMSITAPFAEIVNNWDYQLYPQVPQTGVLTYFMRPPAPKFSYTTVSARVIVYNAALSTQLKWSDDEVIPLLVKTLSSIGINLSEQDLLQYAEAKDQQNYLSTMRP